MSRGGRQSTLCILHDRHAAQTCVEELPYRAELHDLARLGERNDSPPAVAVGSHRSSAPIGDVARLGLCVRGAMNLDGDLNVGSSPSLTRRVNHRNRVLVVDAVVERISST
jgi:hypothetical protein